MKRRTILKGAGAVLVLAAGGGVWRASDRGVFSTGRGPAYEPWSTWRGDPSEGPLVYVRAAILAANPHNTQPWLFRLSASRLDLFADPRRSLGPLDPFRRELYLGLGCALENLHLAAQVDGFLANVAYLPDAASLEHAAAIGLTRAPAAPTGSRSPAATLHAAIPRRHTNRAPYDMARPVSQAALQALGGLNDDPELMLFWFAEEGKRRRLAEVMVRATEAMRRDDEVMRASAQWERFRWREMQAFADGLTVDALGLSAKERALAKWLPTPDPARVRDLWQRATRERQTATASVFGVLAGLGGELTPRGASGGGGVRATEAARWLRCGRLWQRLHLWGTTQDLAMQPMNQAIERAEREAVLGVEPTIGKALEELIGEPRWKPLMIFRLGYPTLPALPTPRRSVHRVLA
ncbi:MAG: hypothetical protein HYY96_02345 [Candidatus Tectomicrobia bacterium]|nr:hypothetical protein [Candidatus Tectomicrobia bacterium]